MKTIKEILSPLFRDYARQRSLPVFDDVCRKSWFTLPVSTDGLYWENTAEPDRENHLIHCGANLFVTGEGLNLPYREQVIVRKKPTGMWMIQYVVVHELSARGKVQEVSGKMFEYHPDDGGYYTVSDSAHWDAERAESFILMARQLGKWLEHPALHLASVAPVARGKSKEWSRAHSHFEFLYPFRTAHSRHPVRDQWEPIFHSPQLTRPGAGWRGPRQWENKLQRRLYRWVDKTTLGNGKEGAHASA